MNNKPRDRMHGFDPIKLYENTPGIIPGEAELIIGGFTDQVVGRIAAFMLMAVRTKDNKLPFCGITIIAPPMLAWTRSDEEILNLILNGIEYLREEVVDTNEAAYVIRLLSVVRSEHMDVAEVLKVVEATERKQLLLFPDAGKYRNSAISLASPRGRTDVLIAEDQWVPHVASLISSCIEIAKSKESFLIFEVTEPSPTRESNQKILVDINGLYPALLTLEGEIDPGKIIVNNMSKWAAMASTGRVEEALTELDAANLNKSYKSQLAIQIVSRSGDSERIVRVIRDELARGIEFPPEIAAGFGCITERHGDSNTAERLFGSSIEHVLNQGVLESVLLSCTMLKNQSLIDRSFNQLAALFPGSELLRTNCELRLMEFCQLAPYEKQQLPSRVGFSNFEEYLVDILCMQAQVNYEELLKVVEETWGNELDLARICCAINAHARGDSQKALDFAFFAADTGRYKYQSVNIILMVIRRMLLMDEVPREELEIYKLPILFVVRYLATHPVDARTRVILTDIFSVESCGAVGLPIIASLTLDVAKKGATLALGQNRAKPEQASEQVLSTFFERASSWLMSLPSIELGVTNLPKELMDDNPQGLIASFTEFIRYQSTRREENTDLHTLELCVYLICLLSPYVQEGNADLDALRQLAILYCLEGQSQKARDLAEQILETAGSSPARQRFAWASFADIYHRTHSPIDALVGISCAFACDTKVYFEDHLQENYTLLRVTRDLNFHKVAMELVTTCRNLLKLQSMDKVGCLRMDTIELGLRLSDLTNKDLVTLTELVSDATKHCKEVINDNDELLPACAILAQSVRLLEDAGGQVESETKDILYAALKGIGSRMAEYVQVVSATAPSVADAINLQNRRDETKNLQDIPGDLFEVVMVARRLLLTHGALPNPEEAVVAIELLAERAIMPPEGARKLDDQWPANYVIKLSSEGLAVLMLGIDERGELVSVLAMEGKLEIQRSLHQAGTFRKHMEKWSEKYPYRYGFIEREDGNNEFYLTMRDFQIPVPSFQNILVVAEPALQQIPFNLILDNDEFAGKTRAIGCAPSLTWFEAARRNLANNDGRRVAWVSTSEDPEKVGTLEMILERMRPTLEQYDFLIDTSRHIPKNFAGAQMAVVTAHGGLTTEKRFIHKISDEEVLVESPVMLARSLAGIELVILFVCSGGRIDRHPILNTTIGLPKMLLEHGCRTVIASPWPLAAVVTAPWLEGFMGAWEMGKTASSAVFNANQAVNERLGDPPQYALAMAVYGDMLLRKRM